MAGGSARFRIEGQDATAAAWASAVGRANSASKQMAGMFKAAFAGVSISALIGFGRDAIQLGDDLEKARIKAKLTGEEMSTLAYAAGQADVELTSLSTALQKMQIFLSKAAAGEKANVEGLEAIGVTIKDLQGLHADKQFEKIAEHVAALRTEEDRARAVTEIFGKAGGDLLPMFSKGAAGIREARIEAQKMGYVFNDEQLAKLADADDAIKRLDRSWEAFWVTITSKVAPDLARTLDMLHGQDFRSAGEKVDAQIEVLERRLRDGTNFGMGGGVGTISPESRAAIERDLQLLRARRALLDAPRLSEAGGSRGRAAIAPGFKPDTTAADKAAAEEEKRRIEAMVKAHDELADAMWRTQEANVAFNRGLEDTLEVADQWVEEGMDALGQRLEDLPIETWSDTFKDMADDFATAVGNMAADGRAEWDSMLRYWGMQLLSSGIKELIANIFSNSASSGGGGGGGIWSAVGGFVSSLFGGTRDSGGRGRPGQVYAIGKGAQPELFVPDSSGTFIPNAGRGGGSNITIAPTYHVTTRNDDPRALQRMFQENNRQIFETLERVHGLKPA